MDELPINVEDKFYITNSFQTTKNCFVELLRRRPITSLCTISKLNYTKPHVEQLSATDYIVLINNNKPFTIEYRCHPKTVHFRVIYHTTKLTLTPHCEFYLNNQSFPYEHPMTSSTTFLLPNISLETLPQTEFSNPSLHDLHKIHSIFNNLHPVKILDPPTIHTFTYLWVFISLALISFIGLLFYCSKKPLCINPFTTPTTPSVHYNPTTGITIPNPTTSTVYEDMDVPLPHPRNHPQDKDDSTEPLRSTVLPSSAFRLPF